MTIIRKLALATAVAGAALLGGCASQGDVGGLDSRVGKLEQSITQINQRLDAMAASDRAAADRAAKAAEDARAAAQSAADSAAKVDAAFRKSLRK